MMKIGKKAKGGIGRSTSRIGSRVFSTNQLDPDRQPSSTPATAAIANPSTTRRRLTATSVGIVVLVCQPACSTSIGEGIMAAGTQPICALTKLKSPPQRHSTKQ